MGYDAHVYYSSSVLSLDEETIYIATSKHNFENQSNNDKLLRLLEMVN
jgi:hypothetical protein